MYISRNRGACPPIDRLLSRPQPTCRRRRLAVTALVVGVGTAAALGGTALPAGAARSHTGRFHAARIHAAQVSRGHPGVTPATGGPDAAYVTPFTEVTTLASTVPGNGDVNPYGVAVVPRSSGDLVAGDTLVSNFNNSSNLQGTGSTIVEISPSGHRTVFAHIRLDKADSSLGGIGLTTALAVLRNGWVVVGDLPTANGSAKTAKAGGLIVLDDQGKVAETITGTLVNGPWDLTATNQGSSADLFVSNVLNGTVAAKGAVIDEGTVVRIGVTTPQQADGVPQVTSEQVVGSGFAEETNKAALVIGPTGLGLGADGTLYVADTLDNRVTAISDALGRTTTAGTGVTLSRNGALNAPLGLVVAPDGDILTVNGGDGNLVDITSAGTQAAIRTLDLSGSPAGSGALFGLAVVPGHGGVYFVDDATNTFELLGVPTPSG